MDGLEFVSEIACSVGRYGIRGWDHGRCCGAASRMALAASGASAAQALAGRRIHVGHASPPERSNQVVLSWV